MSPTPRPAKLMSVAEVAQRLGISRASVYCKIRVRSLCPIDFQTPYRFWASEIEAYAAIRAAHQVPRWHGRLTATQALQRFLARVAPQPLSIATLVQLLHQHGIGVRWRHPQQTCGALLARGPFRRVRRGWYALEPTWRSPPE
jgi:predicted DNA-binding transcriptional regulator AlpA